jgi:protein transport protein SEC61 subunit gamma-like protein
MEEAAEKQTFLSKTKSFLLECRRVLKVTKKPNKEEFVTIVKVTGVGIILIGLLGFAVTMVQSYFV